MPEIEQCHRCKGRSVLKKGIHMPKYNFIDNLSACFATKTKLKPKNGPRLIRIMCVEEDFHPEYGEAFKMIVIYSDYHNYQKQAKTIVSRSNWANDLISNMPSEFATQAETNFVMGMMTEAFASSKNSREEMNEKLDSIRRSPTNPFALR